jgi:polyribonucleotide nucleotidyltransferase
MRCGVNHWSLGHGFGCRRSLHASSYSRKSRNILHRQHSETVSSISSTLEVCSGNIRKYLSSVNFVAEAVDVSTCAMLCICTRS